MNDRPCYGCPDRYPGCSDHCRKPDFLAVKEKRKKIAEAKKAARSIDGYTADAIRKNRRVRK